MQPNIVALAVPGDLCQTLLTSYCLWPGLEPKANGIAAALEAGQLKRLELQELNQRPADELSLPHPGSRQQGSMETGSGPSGLGSGLWCWLHLAFISDWAAGQVYTWPHEALFGVVPVPWCWLHLAFIVAIRFISQIHVASVSLRQTGHAPSMNEVFFAPIEI